LLLIPLDTLDRALNIPEFSILGLLMLRYLSELSQFVFNSFLRLLIFAYRSQKVLFEKIILPKFNLSF